MNITKENMQVLRDLVATHKTIRYSVLAPQIWQTVENHTNRMLALAPVIAEIANLNFDTNELNSMILAHDLGELGLKNDVTLIEQQDATNKKNKHEYETECKHSLAKKYGEWLTQLFDEYERQETDLARFVKWLDKYEAQRHMTEIHKYTTYVNYLPKYIPFFLNSSRLIDATHALPAMLDFTIKHLEREIKPLYIRMNFADKYKELIAKLNPTFNS